MPTYFHFQYIDNLHVRSTSYVMNFFSSPSSPQMSRVIPSLDSPFRFFETSFVVKLSANQRAEQIIS